MSDTTFFAPFPAVTFNGARFTRFAMQAVRVLGAIDPYAVIESGVCGASLLAGTFFLAAAW